MSETPEWPTMVATRDDGTEVRIEYSREQRAYVLPAGHYTAIAWDPPLTIENDQTLRAEYQVKYDG